MKLPKYWRPASKASTHRFSEEAKEYLVSQCKKHNCTETIWLNTLLYKMKKQGKDFDPTPHFPTEEERLALAVSELSKEQHEQSKKTNFGTVRRPIAKRTYKRPFKA